MLSTFRDDGVHDRIMGSGSSSRTKAGVITEYSENTFARSIGVALIRMTFSSILVRLLRLSNVSIDEILLVF